MSLPFECARCADCPRRCDVLRPTGSGFCGADDQFRVASLCLHRGEEPVISGPVGSITLFFPGCNLRCVFCQNHQISRREAVAETPAIALEALIDRIEALIDQGGHNLNFVSPSHMALQVRAIVLALRERERRLPVVYNSNGYDRLETLQALEGLVDVYMPDMKYGDGEVAEAFSGAGDYVEVATLALTEMRRQVGARLQLDDAGLAQRGMIVRHLVLPGHVDNSLQALDIVADVVSPRTFLSLMAQYHPDGDAWDHPDLGRMLRPEEYEAVVEHACALGFDAGWLQDLADSPRHYRPDFRSPHPFERRPPQ